MTVMGWYLPYVRVQRRARLRLEQIDREVPELVDLLVTTVEGGVGFAAGLQLASRSIEGPLGQELRLALREQSLGLTPEEALRNLSLRVDSPATRAFTQALVQGESLGVSIGTILRDLAIDMRKRRRQTRGGARTEDADEDPVPADRADPAGDVHRHARPGDDGSAELLRILMSGPRINRVGRTTPLQEEPSARAVEDRSVARRSLTRLDCGCGAGRRPDRVCGGRRRTSADTVRGRACDADGCRRRRTGSSSRRCLRSRGPLSRRRTGTSSSLPPTPG